MMAKNDAVAKRMSADLVSVSDLVSSRKDYTYNHRDQMIY